MKDLDLKEQTMFSERNRVIAAPAFSVLAAISAMNGYGIALATFAGISLVLCASLVYTWMVTAISNQVVTGVMERLEAYEAAARENSTVEVGGDTIDDQDPKSDEI